MNNNKASEPRESLPPAERRSLPPTERRSLAPSGAERRQHPRFDVTWAVDCSDGEHFLYSYITNISEMGIFISTRNPPEIGSKVKLNFEPTLRSSQHPDPLSLPLPLPLPLQDQNQDQEPGQGQPDSVFALEGLVTWINPVRANGDNPNPGFGVQFTDLSPELRERLVSLVHAIAYLPDELRPAV